MINSKKLIGKSTTYFAILQPFPFKINGCLTEVGGQRTEDSGWRMEEG